MIAADGAQSPVRAALGVRMDGKKDVYDSVNILLEADLRPWTEDRPAALYFIENERLRGTFLTINAADRWGFLVNSLKAQGYAPEDFTPERSAELVRLAAGVPDLPVKVLGVAPWVASAHVAEQYRHGRIFLAGDAAHEMPPTGGFGMNTGVQDVHNLCWKLALVLQGRAEDPLLQTYHDERQPLARTITEQSLANAISMGRLQKTRETTGARPEYLNEQGMIFGARYQSAAVVPDGSVPPAVANPITDYVASACPGGRAPHAWLNARTASECRPSTLSARASRCWPGRKAPRGSRRRGQGRQARHRGRVRHRRQRQTGARRRTLARDLRHRRRRRGAGAARRLCRLAQRRRRGRSRARLAGAMAAIQGRASR